MKKHILTLVAIAAGSVAAMGQITLGDAYGCLADLGPMGRQSDPTVQIGKSAEATVRNVKTARCSGVKGSDMQNQFIYTVESLPIREQVFGANNGNDMAVIYAEPAGNGVYNILVLMSDTQGGDYVASYGQTDAAGVAALRDYDVTMDDASISLNYGGNNSLVSMK